MNDATNSLSTISITSVLTDKLEGHKFNSMKFLKEIAIEQVGDTTYYVYEYRLSTALSSSIQFLAIYEDMLYAVNIYLAKNIRSIIRFVKIWSILRHHKDIGGINEKALFVRWLRLSSSLRSKKEHRKQAKYLDKQNHSLLFLFTFQNQLQNSVTALTLCIYLQSLIELLLAEVGPHRLWEVHLGV